MNGEDRWVALAGHRARLVRLARARGLDRHDAQDVAAEAIARAAALPQLHLDRLGGLLATITVRLCADLHAQRAVAARWQSRTVPPPWQPPADDDVCDRAEARWLLGQAATRLSGRELAALLARLDELSIGQTGAALDLDYRAAAGALTRATAKLRSAAHAAARALVVLALQPRRARPAIAPAGVALVAFAIAASIQAGPPERAAPGRSREAVTVTTPLDRPRPAVRPPAEVSAEPAPGLARPAPDMPDGRWDVRTPTVELGPVHDEGTLVSIDMAEPAEQRVRRCIHNGVDIAPPSVVCRENPR